MESASHVLPAVSAGPAASLARLARAARGYLRHLPDRALHPLRRRAARARVRAAGVPRSVLFVCVGNIYRSPYAAGSFARALPPGVAALVDVSSAGFLGPARPCPDDAVECAARRRVDLGAHRSSLLSLPRVRGAGLVVVMDVRQRDDVCAWFGADRRRVVLLGDLDPEPIETRGVRDPWDEGRDVLEATYARVDRCVHALAAAMVASPSGD